MSKKRPRKKSALRAPRFSRNGSGTDSSDPASFPPAVDSGDAESLTALLAHTLRQANRPLGMDEILRITRLPRKAKKTMEASLLALQAQGTAVRGSGGWAIPARTRVIEGTLSVQRGGMGFVSPAGARGGADVYIHPAAMNGAWHGDTVEVLILPGKRGPSPEGRVTRVVRRSLAELPAYALRERKDGLWMCAPSMPRIQALFVTDVSALEGEVRENDLLLIRPGEQSGPNLWLATATSNLEREESPSAQERLVKSKYGIPGDFPRPVLEIAGSFPPDPAEEDMAGRRDLRDCPFVTIDGRGARDFDDAVHVDEQGSGYRLRVAIADVSYYVRGGSPLDAEARLRGNSFYFPLSVEPMLPEALSNGLCSLKPNRPRLAVVADMLFSRQGERREAHFYEAAITSHARLTYGQIERGLFLHEEEDLNILKPVLPMLRKAEALARAMTALRREQGALDFAVPEAETLFDAEGRIMGMAPRKRHFGHRLIEAFMIAANEAVAEFLERRGQGALYRVHAPPDPEKLTAFMDFLARTGMGVAAAGRGPRKLPTAKEMGRLLEEIKGAPQEYAINRLLLRSMMQARYQPENEGHFGLASACYCHFTSPIRRYADLVNHRALKRALNLHHQRKEAGGPAFAQPGADNAASEEKSPDRPRLSAIAEHINDTERTAVEAEREIHKRLGVLLLRDRVGEEFAGIVSGLADFGIFVELPSVMAEGMVPLASLTDDYYQYLPEKQEIRGTGTRRAFHLGQQVAVLLTDVHLDRMEITLSFAETEQKHGLPAARREKKKRKYK